MTKVENSNSIAKEFSNRFANPIIFDLYSQVNHLAKCIITELLIEGPSYRSQMRPAPKGFLPKKVPTGIVEFYFSQKGASKNRSFLNLIYDLQLILPESISQYSEPYLKETKQLFIEKKIHLISEIPKLQLSLAMHGMEDFEGKFIPPSNIPLSDPNSGTTKLKALLAFLEYKELAIKLSIQQIAYGYYLILEDYQRELKEMGLNNKPTEAKELTLNDWFKKSEKIQPAINVLKEGEQKAISISNQYIMGNRKKGIIVAWFDALNELDMVHRIEGEVSLLNTIFNGLNITEKTLNSNGRSKCGKVKSYEDNYDWILAHLKEIER